MDSRALLIVATSAGLAACVAIPPAGRPDRREPLTIAPVGSGRWQAWQGRAPLGEEDLFRIAGDDVSLALVRESHQRAQVLTITGGTLIGVGVIELVLSLVIDETWGRVLVGAMGGASVVGGLYLTQHYGDRLDAEFRVLDRAQAEHAAAAYNRRLQLHWRF